MSAAPRHTAAHTMARRERSDARDTRVDAIETDVCPKRVRSSLKSSAHDTWEGACLIDLENPADHGRFEIRGRHMKIGRVPSCDILIDRPTVSREHATLSVEAGRVYIRDDRSTNGTYVNDEPVAKAELHDGDCLWLGHARFKFLCGHNFENRYDLIMRRLAFEDGLTGIANRRSFDEHTRHALRQRARDGSDVAVILLDLDYFKSVNDAYGHHAGDVVLTRVARVLQQSIPLRAHAARFGGEEFALVIPDCGATTSVEVAENIRHAIASQHFTYEGQQLQVTISGGVAITGDHNDTRESLLARADAALYSAKRSGRDRIVCG